MAQPLENFAPGAARFRIGSVAELTGLTVHTLRAWERRHGVLEPERSPGGTRLYGEEDVIRLRLLRALTECGEPIAEVAQLPADALRDRLARHAGLAASAGPKSLPLHGGEPLRLAVLDGSLPEQLAMHDTDALGLRVVAAGVSPHSLEAALAELPTGAADVLVAQLSELGREPVEALGRLAARSGASLQIVVFGFASRRRLAELADAGARLVRGPISVEALRQAIADAITIREAERRRESSPVRTARLHAVAAGRREPRRFDDAQLARLREVRPGLECECPNHLATLVSQLVAFERYADACEDSEPEDAALHRALAEATARSRADLETLLVRVCEHDGIPLE